MITLEQLTDPKWIAAIAVFLSNVAVWMAGKRFEWTPQRKVALGSGCVLLVFTIGLVLNPDAYTLAGAGAVQRAFLVLSNALIVLLMAMGAPILKDAVLMVIGRFEETVVTTSNRGGAASMGDTGVPVARVMKQPTPKAWRAWTS